MIEIFTGSKLQSTITKDGYIKIELVEAQWSDPGEDEVIVRVEASPLNPSDLALLFGPAELSSLEAHGSDERPVLTAFLPQASMNEQRGRLDQPITPGNEGAGLVVAAGGKVQHLLGKRVGIFGGCMYAQYRTLRAQDCIVLPDGVAAADGAAMFINPLTALCFIETMKSEGHSAIVHFAAASNLGQMLNRICLIDGIPLVNVVRTEEQVSLLRNTGAKYVLNSSIDGFEQKLVEAVADTGATLAFDPIGGGRQAIQVLAAMETAANRKMTVYDRYGTGEFKQVYIYGVLDTTPTILDRWVGYAWSVGGWMMAYRLKQIGTDGVARQRARIVDELTTTFASRYRASLTLTEALQLKNVHAYMRKATGEKYLICPNT